jgi:hypothetical protein
VIALLDLVLAGSRIATSVGVVFIVAALAVLTWLAARNRPRPAVKSSLPAAARVRRHRGARRPVRAAACNTADAPTAVIPVLRDQTELIPAIGGGRRG